MGIRAELAGEAGTTEGLRVEMAGEEDTVVGEGGQGGAGGSIAEAVVGCNPRRGDEGPFFLVILESLGSVVGVDGVQYFRPPKR